MNLLLIANAFTCLCAFVSFVRGIVKFFQPRKAVYAQMITLATGAMFFGRLYQVVRLATVGDIVERFQLGVLGVIGSLIFLFSANYGIMDSLADDGSKKFKKYRFIAACAPLFAIVMYVIFFLFSDIPMLARVVSAFITIVIAGASYYNLKHLILPDVDFGVINCLKGYNVLSLIFEFLCLSEMISFSRANNIAVLIINIIMGVVLVLIIPTVERGIKKWST